MTDASNKPFSIAFGNNRPKSTIKPTNIKKRPHSALAEPDSDHEERIEPQLVTSFDQSVGGAISATRATEKTPLVIKAQKNRDWREESRRKRGKNLLPADVQVAEANTKQIVRNEAVEKDVISSEAGLKFVNGDKGGGAVTANGQSINGDDHERHETEPTADEEAIQALLGKERKSNLVIPTVSSSYEEVNGGQAQQDEYEDEDNRFKADVASRPDSCTLEEYARIPVEDFGSAMLRGMGWKEGQVVGKSSEKSRAPRTVERRPALLGIGAKEVPGGDLDALGAWGKAAKKKKKADMAYSPVLLKNQKTGEMLTEEELEKKRSEVKKTKGDEDWRDRRDRNLAADRDRKTDRLALGDVSNGSYKRRERSRSRESRHHKDSRRNRSLSRERTKHSSSARNRSRSSDRGRHTPRRERSRSRDRYAHGRNYDDHDRGFKDKGRTEKGYRRR